MQRLTAWRLGHPVRSAAPTGGVGVGMPRLPVMRKAYVGVSRRAQGLHGPMWAWCPAAAMAYALAGTAFACAKP